LRHLDQCVKIVELPTKVVLIEGNMSNGDPIKLGTIAHVDPRKVWEGEASIFTPWLAANLSLLGGALGYDLELVGTESRSGDFLCDIIARETGSNRTVVIENQLERTDHDHLGKLLTYAASNEAGIVIWISPEVRDDHRDAVDWLNRHSTEGIEFFAVQLETISIDSSLPAPNFRLVAFPNTWSKTGPKASGPEPSVKQERYRAFFQALIDELRDKYHFTNARRAQPQSWYSFASGISGIHYNAVFDSEDRLRAELYVDVGNVEHNKAIFDAFFKDRGAIEDQFGEPLIWDRLDNRQASRITAARNDSGIDEAQKIGPLLQQWVTERLVVLKRVFGPRLREVVASTKPVANPITDGSGNATLLQT
jgi:hypothetical protein